MEQDLIAYGWERRQQDGSYVLIPATLCATEGGARHLAIGVAGSGWLWGGDKESQFRQQWNGGEIRPATFTLTRVGPTADKRGASAVEPTQLRRADTHD